MLIGELMPDFFEKHVFGAFEHATLEGWHLGVEFAISACIFAPLWFMSPSAKRSYMPISFGLFVINFSAFVFLTLGTGLIQFLIIFWIASGLYHLYSNLHVCQNCGETVGLRAGKNEIHRCVLKTPSPDHSANTNIKVALPELSSTCIEELKIEFNAETGILLVPEGQKMKQLRKILGIFLSLFILVGSYFSFIEDFEGRGIFLCLSILGILYVIHSSFTEIDIRKRSITKKKSITWKICRLAESISGF